MKVESIQKTAYGSHKDNFYIKANIGVVASTEEIQNLLSGSYELKPVKQAKQARENSLKLLMDIIYERIRHSHSFSECFYLPRDKEIQERVSEELTSKGYKVTLDSNNWEVLVQW